MKNLRETLSTDFKNVLKSASDTSPRALPRRELLLFWNLHRFFWLSQVCAEGIFCILKSAPFDRENIDKMTVL